MLIYKINNYTLTLTLLSSNIININIIDTSTAIIYDKNIIKEHIKNNLMTIEQIYNLIINSLNNKHQYNYTILNLNDTIKLSFTYDSNIITITEEFILETTSYTNKHLHMLIQELTFQVKNLENKINDMSIKDLCIPVFNNPRNPHQYKILNLGYDTIIFNVDNPKQSSINNHPKLFDERNYMPNNIIFDNIILNNHEQNYDENIKFISSLKFINKIHIRFNPSVQLTESIKKILYNECLAIMNNKKIILEIDLCCINNTTINKDHILDYVMTILQNTHKSVSKIIIMNIFQLTNTLKKFISWCKYNNIMVV